MAKTQATCTHILTRTHTRTHARTHAQADGVHTRMCIPSSNVQVMIHCLISHNSIKRQLLNKDHGIITFYRRSSRNYFKKPINEMYFTSQPPPPLLQQQEDQPNKHHAFHNMQYIHGSSRWTLAIGSHPSRRRKTCAQDRNILNQD